MNGKKLEFEQVKELNETLIVDENKIMKKEIVIDVNRTFSIVQFLRLKNEKEKHAWLRCRGSSILNFDSFARWQMIFIQYESMNQQKNQSISMEILDLLKLNFEINQI